MRYQAALHSVHYPYTPFFRKLQGFFSVLCKTYLRPASLYAKVEKKLAFLCKCVYYNPTRGVAQPGRVLALGARCRMFKSCRPDQIRQYYSCVCGQGCRGLADDVGQDYFEVVVSDVPQGPCRYVLNQNWAIPEGIYLNNAVDSAEDGSDCREENNTIAFVFDATLGRASDDSDDDAEADNCR